MAIDIDSASTPARRVMIDRLLESRYRISLGDVAFDLSDLELATLARAVHAVAAKNPLLLARILLLASS